GSPYDLAAAALGEVDAEARARGVRVGAELSSSLPAIRSRGDREVRALERLLRCAIRAASAGDEVELGARRARGHVAFSVSLAGSAGRARERVAMLVPLAARGLLE
ncbi:MAG TPA: hypothetical protein VHF22_11660, partial [Planctomycetota bacterium]|nr:hypothetical protein [Planctomycetota bacterium]